MAKPLVQPAAIPTSAGLDPLQTSQMGTVHNDPDPSNLPAEQESEQLFFPPGSIDLHNRNTNAASAAGALNATVHLLQNYTSPTLEATDQQLPPLETTNFAVKPAMASRASQPLQQRKLCFVTVGATAPFDDLVTAVQTPRFVSALEAAGFTNLLIQHGHKDKVMQPQDVDGIRISSFDFRRDGIQREINGAKGDMKKAKADSKGSKSKLEGLDFGSEWQNATWEEGVVISHAGSGSIMDALRVSAPLIVVPNSSLLDNHQIDLARELAKQGYVVHGKVEKLDQALTAIESLRQKRRHWPPPAGSKDRGGRGLIGIMDEEMGYTDLKSHTKASRLYLD